jgi:hypothetical protein
LSLTLNFRWHAADAGLGPLPSFFFLRGQEKETKKKASPCPLIPRCDFNLGAAKELALLRSAQTAFARDATPCVAPQIFNRNFGRTEGFIYTTTTTALNRASKDSIHLYKAFVTFAAWAISKVSGTISSAA